MFPWNQLLDILDTVVKIGLGAAISAILTYKLTKTNNRHEIQKTRWLRQCELLEACGEKVEIYFYAMRDLLSGVAGTKLGNERVHIPQFSESQWKFFTALDDRYLETRREVFFVIARLRLLGAEDAAGDLSEVFNMMGEFRDPFVIQRIEPKTSKEVEQIRDNIQKQVVVFHGSLNKAYEKLNPLAPAN